MRPSVVRVVAKKELRELARDGRLRLLGGLVVLLALAALAFGAEHTLRERRARAQARERAAAQWEGQGRKNPHVAAHYGTYAFAPADVATAIDPGVSAYLGRAVKLEAHQRNLAAHAAAQDAGGAPQVGAFSVSSVLLQLVPLLIVALGHGLWSREREGGTLRQLLAIGVGRGALFFGKAAALFGVVAALLLPAALAVVGTLWALGGGDAATLGRLALLGLAYAGYFAVFGGLTLYASAVARSSRAALVGMVGAWGFFCLVAPKAAAELAGILRPLPSEAELARDVARSLRDGVDGRTPRDVAVEALTADLMAEEGLANTGMMVDASYLAGFELRAEAAFEDAVYDHHVRALEDRIAAQEAVATWVGLLSPYVAMRALSAGLCGTDYAHHRHFTDYAETWRKALVGQLNSEFARRAGARGWDYEADPELWKRAPAFEYRAPGAAFALRTHAASLGALSLWLVLAFGPALRAARRMTGA